MKKVIVTGANGFLGSNLCKKLIEKNYEVSVFVRENSDISELINLKIKYFYGDITDLKSLLLAFENQDYVFHLAGLISYKKYDRKKMQLINVTGTENVLKACIKNNIEKLLYLSSVVTIGSSFDAKVLNEQSEYKIKNLNLGYFETKRSAEEIIIKAAKENKIFAVCANPSTIYGFADAKKESRKNQIKVAQGNFKFYTAGGVNVISVDDATDGIILALEKGKNAERYILSNENLSIKKLFRIIADSAGVKHPNIYLPTFLLHTIGFFGDLLKSGLSRENAYTASMFHWFDNTKAKTELGFQPKKSAEQAINDSVLWMKKNNYLNKLD